MGIDPKFSSNGIIGVFHYWNRWAQNVVLLSYICFSIYLITILADSFWKKVIGAGTLASVIISMIFAFISLGMHILFQFSILSRFQNIIKIVYICTNTVALITCAIAIPSFSPISSFRYFNDLIQYSNQTQMTDTQAAEFYNLTQTNIYAVYQYVQKRTIDAKLPTESIFTVWFTLFILYISCIVKFPEKQEEEPKQNETFQVSFHEEEEEEETQEDVNN